MGAVNRAVMESLAVLAGGTYRHDLAALKQGLQQMMGPQASGQSSSDDEEEDRQLALLPAANADGEPGGQPWWCGLPLVLL
jgi:hypothetical protein